MLIKLDPKEATIIWMLDEAIGYPRFNNVSMISLTLIHGKMATSALMIISSPPFMGMIFDERF
jgi:hypothetical protein